MSRYRIRIAVIVVLVLPFVLLSLGCRTKIGDITEKPDEYRNQQVILYGEVDKKLPLPFMETAAYLLKDDTGEIWVLTKRTLLPQVGETLKVTGVIEAGIRVGTREFGLVLSEQKREQATEN